MSPALDSNRPAGDRRMSANPNANGGIRMRELSLPPLAPHESRWPPGAGSWGTHQSAGALAEGRGHSQPGQFPHLRTDETASNRLDAVYRGDRQTMAGRDPGTDEHLARRGQVIELLNENLMQGLLEGYLLTGRHGLFNSYEAFIHVVDSMFNQYAKWLEVRGRRALAATDLFVQLPAVLPRVASDHNGFSHQDPGFLDLVVNKRASLVRVYLPPDANTCWSPPSTACAPATM